MKWEKGGLSLDAGGRPRADGPVKALARQRSENLADLLKSQNNLLRLVAAAEFLRRERGVPISADCVLEIDGTRLVLEVPR